MIRALGYSSSSFNPAWPGRLCRGRERWIEPFELDADTPEAFRLVVTGATFSDDSASDALRGLHHSGVDLANLLVTLFPRRPMLAFAEDGHPADIPEGAVDVEMYTGHRAGGRSEALMVRWMREVNGVREIREVLGPEVDSDRVRGFVIPEQEGPPDEQMMDRLFLLVGMSCLDSPPARFQPSALPELLQTCRAVILLHRDKHGTAVGIYSREPLKAEPRLDALAKKEDILLVRFAIPPMLARWDRALAELRSEWLATRPDPFPVPAAPDQSRWEPRHRRRGRRGDLSREADEVGAEFPEIDEEDDLLVDEEDGPIDDLGDDDDEIDDGEELLGGGEE